MPKRLPDQPEPVNNPLADLLRAKGFEAAPEPEPAAKAAAGGANLAKQGKLVVRRERKGRGGKTVTLVQGVAGCPAVREDLARALRKALGCGSTVEGGDIVLQGDIPDRAIAWLQSHGAKQVVRGN